MPPPKKTRHFRDGHKRIVAARQSWKCSTCKEILQSSFQVDHVIPLFLGGEDAIENATALCANCHSLKTQRETIERHAATRKKKEEEARKRQAAFEEETRRETYKAIRITENASNGKSTCHECGTTFFTIFKHAKCLALERTLEQEEDNPFIRFMYIQKV